MIVTVLTGPADEKCLETQKAFPLEQKDCLHQCDVVSIRIQYLQ